MTWEKNVMIELHAHTPNEKGEWHSLREHLLAVSELACEFAEKFDSSGLAQLAGLFHDLGKANPAFQKYLEACAGGQRPKSAPHAIWGAALAYALVYKHLKNPEGWKLLSLPIQGHHAGLDDAGITSLKIEEFLTQQADALNLMQESIRAMTIPIPRTLKLPAYTSTNRELFIRMLFSAMVDADYLDTERHFSSEQAALRVQTPTLEQLWDKFQRKQQAILRNDTMINRVRKEVYDACVEAAASQPGFYRLTVPTGGGKTRSGLAFGLRHALIHGLHRVIIAIPYTSIIDQTAQVYKEILGSEAVLEHHSALELPEDQDRQDEKSVRQRLATENWDAPLIVTTTVQLFESLFSNRPSKVRKLHRLARAVIVLDEVQTLPPELLRPTLDVLKLLATPVEQGGYGSTIVLCTATQPAFEDSRWIDAFRGVPVQEIVPHYQQHFSVLKRVHYSRRSEPLSWEALAGEVKDIPQVLVVLNTRKDALALMKALGDTPDVFHLSTLLCGAHRKKVLAEVRRRLDPKNPQPVRLISTQVVEAGVDLDFPVVYRAVGPLDRIVQAAGRCNREGRLESGSVIIFEPAEGKAPSGPYMVGIEKARFLLQEYPSERLHDPDLYRDYFHRLFGDVDLDKKHIQAYREELNYPEVAKRYRLIERNTVSVVVPYEDALTRLSSWEAAPGHRTWRALQPYIVNLYRYEVQQKRDWLEQRSEGLYVWTGSYDEKIGLVEGYSDPCDLVV